MEQMQLLGFTFEVVCPSNFRKGPLSILHNKEVAIIREQYSFTLGFCFGGL